MLGNASVAADAFEMPDSPACALRPPVADDSHRRAPIRIDARGRRRGEVIKRSGGVGLKVES